MAEGAARTTGPQVTVLICDDAPAMRFLLRTVIELRAGLSVAGEAADGNEAIAQAELLQPDVILLDLSMPHRTGLEALPEINRVAPGAQVLILSGFAASVMSDGAIDGRVAGYLQKGTGPDEILASIEEAAAAPRSDGPGRN